MSLLRKSCYFLFALAATLSRNLTAFLYTCTHFVHILPNLRYHRPRDADVTGTLPSESPPCCDPVKRNNASRKGAHLGGVAWVGAPGELGHAEAQDGDNVDVDAAVPQRRHRAVHRIRVRRRHIRRHLRACAMSASGDPQSLSTLSGSKVSFII